MTLPPSLRYLPSGIYVDATLGDAGREIATPEWGATAIDGRAIRTKPAFLRAWADVFGFPAHFGMNWDAFADCAGDLSGLSPGDHLILYEQFDPFAEAAPHDWTIALRLFPEVAIQWRRDPRRVIVLLRGSLALAPSLPLAVLAPV
jgi:hypothetical protein